MAESKTRTAPVLAFLKARLDEDQVAARCIHRGEEWWQATGRDVTIDGATQSPAIARTDTDQIAAYMVRFGPQRIEAEIRAKRAVITSYEAQAEGASRNQGPLAMAAAGLLPATELAVYVWEGSLRR